MATRSKLLAQQVPRLLRSSCHSHSLNAMAVAQVASLVAVAQRATRVGKRYDRDRAHLCNLQNSVASYVTSLEISAEISARQLCELEEQNKSLRQALEAQANGQLATAVIQDNLWDGGWFPAAPSVPVAGPVFFGLPEPIQLMVPEEAAAALKIQKVLKGFWGRKEAETRRWARICGSAN